MKKIISILIPFLIVITGFIIYSLLSYPTTNPFNVFLFSLERLFHPHKTLKQETIAFLPYWRIADTKYARFDLLSEINYFALNIDKDGNIITMHNNNEDPGWHEWNSQIVKTLIANTQISGGRFTLTLATQRNKIIEELLSNRQAQQKLISNMLEQIHSRHLNGITIDFEYDGKPDDKYRNAFTDFANLFRSKLKEQAPNTTLNLTLMPLAGREPGLFNIPRLAGIFDRFIGMSYDYYSQTSTIAGPVAPMHGFKENKFFFDVITTYDDLKKYLPANKIVMGVPYYGLDWAVEDGKKIQSKTLPTDDPNNYSAVLSYARMREDKDLKPNQCQWDDYALEHWCWYTDKKNVSHQVWFEDNKSIQNKFSFAKDNKLSGIAIWTLGYDKAYPDLWSMIEKDFTEKK